MSDDELTTEVDEHDKVRGLRPKHEFYGTGRIHRSSHLLLFNTREQLALAKRTKTKRWYPGVFEFTMSGTVADESYDACLRREMKEELDVSIETRYLFTFFHSDPTDSSFKAVYLGVSEEAVHPDSREIELIEWKTFEEWELLIAAHPERFAPTLIKAFKIVREHHWPLLS